MSSMRRRRGGSRVSGKGSPEVFARAQRRARSAVRAVCCGPIATDFDLRPQCVRKRRVQSVVRRCLSAVSVFARTLRQEPKHLPAGALLGRVPHRAPSPRHDAEHAGAASSASPQGVTPEHGAPSSQNTRPAWPWTASSPASRRRPRTSPPWSAGALATWCLRPRNAGSGLP